MENERRFHIKHIEIYIIVFIIAVVTAVVGITYAVVASRDAGYTKGYYTIGLKKNEEIPLYGYNFTFNYYFEGTASQRSVLSEQISSIYSERLAYLYASLDETDTYTHYPSIALLNKHPNEEVTLSSLTYEVLSDAYQKTINSQNYSIFSEPLATYWDDAYNAPSATKEAMDPINSEGNRLLLLELSDYYSNRNHVDLELLGDNKAKLKVSEDYLSFLKNNSLDQCIVGLNLLKTSYISKYIVEHLNNANYIRGYLYTDDGLIIQLIGNPENLVYSYLDVTFENQKLMPIKSAQVTLDKYAFLKSDRRFPLSSEENSYYLIKDNQVYFRSNYYDLKDGLPHNEILDTTIFAYGEKYSIVEETYINNELSVFNSVDGIRDYIKDQKLDDLKLLVKLNSDDKTIYYTETLKEYISLFKELDYNLIKI